LQATHFSVPSKSYFLKLFGKTALSSRSPWSLTPRYPDFDAAQVISPIHAEHQGILISTARSSNEPSRSEALHNRQRRNLVRVRSNQVDNTAAHHPPQVFFPYPWRLQARAESISSIRRLSRQGSTPLGVTRVSGNTSKARRASTSKNCVRLTIAASVHLLRGQGENGAALHKSRKIELGDGGGVASFAWGHCRPPWQ